MKEIILSGRGLQKKYRAAEVIKGIDIDIYRGDFTVIMGTSGSGKSTLLHLLSGMDAVSGGEICYYSNAASGLEKNITHATEKELTKLRANNFGFVFQQAHLVSNLTLYENIRMAGYIADTLSENEVKTKADHYIQEMALNDAKDRLPSEASGGSTEGGSGKGCYGRAGDYFCRRADRGTQSGEYNIRSGTVCWNPRTGADDSYGYP